jgi:hypothetical protein
MQSSVCLEDCEGRHSFFNEASEARELKRRPLPRAPFPGFSRALLNCFPNPSERSPIAFLPYFFSRLILGLENTLPQWWVVVRFRFSHVCLVGVIPKPSAFLRGRDPARIANAMK